MSDAASLNGPDRDLRVALVQGDTRWHDPAGNLAHYGGVIVPVSGCSGLGLVL